MQGPTRKRGKARRGVGAEDVSPLSWTSGRARSPASGSACQKLLFLLWQAQAGFSVKIHGEHISICSISEILREISEGPSLIRGSPVGSSSDDWPRVLGAPRGRMRAVLLEEQRPGESELPAGTQMSRGRGNPFAVCGSRLFQNWNHRVLGTEDSTEPGVQKGVWQCELLQSGSSRCARWKHAVVTGTGELKTATEAGRSLCSCAWKISLRDFCFFQF